MDGERLKRLALSGDMEAEREWWRWLDRRAERCAEGEGEECEQDMTQRARWLRRMGSRMDELQKWTARCNRCVEVTSGRAAWWRVRERDWANLCWTGQGAPTDTSLPF